MIVGCRDEAARVWQQRESEWERERAAREQLMQEVRLSFYVELVSDVFLLTSVTCCEHECCVQLYGDLS